MLAARNLSIVLASFNGECFIEEQLDSLFRQTLLPRELIIVDDCSADNTQEVINAFCKNAPFPVFLYSNSARLGYALTFFRAASLSSGSYIAFCDQDDIWYLDKIQVLLEDACRFQESPDLILHYSELYISGQEENCPIYPVLRNKRGLFRSAQLDPFLVVPGHCMIASRELVDAAALLHARLPASSFIGFGHDDLVYFIGSGAGSTLVVPSPLVQWRQHANNACGVPPLVGQSNFDSSIGHAQLMTDLSIRWRNLYLAVNGLAFETSDRYTLNLHKLARTFIRRSKYFHCRSIMSEAANSRGVRFWSFVKAYILYWCSSGLKLKVFSAFARDIASLFFLEVKLMNRS